MRLLLINPNISDSVSDADPQPRRRRSASPGTEIEVLTAPFGVAYIETRFEALIGAYAAATARRRAPRSASTRRRRGLRRPRPRAACARRCRCRCSASPKAALTSACLLGQRFSIVAISQRITAWYRECVAADGLGGRLASIRALDQPLPSIGGVQDEHAQRLKSLAERAVDEDGADVIVLAGAPLAGLARSIKASCRCPWSTACRAPCAMPKRWSRCSPARARAAASRRRRSSRTAACRRRSRRC